MIDNDRLSIYLSSIKRPLPQWLSTIEKEARRDNVPIVKRDTMYLIGTLLSMKRPHNILEVGCGVGFSAIYMAYTLDGTCSITTIENYAPRIAAARENIKRSGYDEIELIEGDATDVLPALSGYYDFVFMDAAKGQYINFWPDIKRLTKSGSIIVTDNVMQDGDILKSHYIVQRRNRTIHKRMREYLYELCQDETMETTILPTGDGVAITVVK